MWSLLWGTPSGGYLCGLPETQETGRRGRQTERMKKTERRNATSEERSATDQAYIDLEKHSQEGDKRQLVETMTAGDTQRDEASAPGGSGHALEELKSYGHCTA